MFRWKKWLPVAMGLAVAVALTAPLSARAGFTLTLTEGAQTQTFNLTSGQLNTVGPIQFGDYLVSVSAQDSAPGLDPTFGGALISQNTFDVKMLNGAATAPLQITVQDNTFSSSPYAGGPNVLLENSLSSTLITSGTVSAYGFLNSSQTSNISLSGPTLSGSTSNSLLVGAPSSNFTLGDYAQVSFNGSGAQVANFTVTTLVPVPEPTTTLSLCMAAPFLGLGVWLRRRKPVP